MKKIHFIVILCACLSVLNVSCSKTAGNAEKDTDNIITDQHSNSPINQGTTVSKGHLEQTVIGDLGADLTNLTFCSAKTVPICAGQTMNVGEVAVQTAINGRTYITYSLKNLWYFKEIHLFAGEQPLIPVNGSGNPVPGQFPFTKTFLAPYNVQKYTFVIDGLDDGYAVAAHCSLVKIGNNGAQLDAQTGWGDGCNGNRITAQGSWGTFMNYVDAGCTLSAATLEPVNLCSNNVDTYFWVNPASPNSLTWRTSVTVGGFTYNEQDSRAIANTIGDADSKYAFMRVATIKLSNTKYELSPILSSSILTIEDWLSTKGKLDPNNLPTGNPQVRNAANIIDSWIASHLCSIE